MATNLTGPPTADEIAGIPSDWLDGLGEYDRPEEGWARIFLGRLNFRVEPDGDFSPYLPPGTKCSYPWQVALLHNDHVQGMRRGAAWWKTRAREAKARETQLKAHIADLEAQLAFRHVGNKTGWARLENLLED